MNNADGNLNKPTSLYVYFLHCIVFRWQDTGFLSYLCSRYTIKSLEFSKPIMIQIFLFCRKFEYEVLHEYYFMYGM